MVQRSVGRVPSSAPINSGAIFRIECKLISAFITNRLTPLSGKSCLNYALLSHFVMWSVPYASLFQEMVDRFGDSGLE